MYRVIAYVPSSDADLGNIIEKEGLEVKKTKKGFKVFLPLIKKGVYQIPRIILIRDHSIFVSLEEKANDYYAQIICAPDGKRINPTFIWRKEALFSIYKAAVIVIASRENYKIEVSLTQIAIKKKHDKVIVQEWEIGTIEEKEFLRGGIIPATLKNFYEPIVAAISKLKHNKSSERPFYIGTK
ncbi:MAG: hypothetical protein MCSN_3290 [Candidatus Microsyncoccus archaeolyticus]|nr:MAG: hypothetical protein MCSN_3290 [Candidatus Parcubacteria bacterium]